MIKGARSIMQMRGSRDQMATSDWLVIKRAWLIMQMKGSRDQGGVAYYANEGVT